MILFPLSLPQNKTAARVGFPHWRQPSTETPFGEDYSFLDLAWNPMAGTNEPTTAPSSFPNLFAEGGGIHVNRFDGDDPEKDSLINTNSAALPYSKEFETALEANAYLNYLKETGQDKNLEFEGNRWKEEVDYINSLPVDERGVFAGPSIRYNSYEPFSDRNYVEVLADYKHNKQISRWNPSGIDPDYGKHMREWALLHPWDNLAYNAAPYMLFTPLLPEILPAMSPVITSLAGFASKAARLYPLITSGAIEYDYAKKANEEHDNEYLDFSTSFFNRNKNFFNDFWEITKDVSNIPRALQVINAAKNDRNLSAVLMDKGLGWWNGGNEHYYTPGKYLTSIITDVAKTPDQIHNGDYDTERVDYQSGSFFNFPSDGLVGTAEQTYLMSRALQRKQFEKGGWIPGTPGDYHLVKNAVGRRNLPVWQTAADAQPRDSMLVALGNIDSRWGGSAETELPNGGSYPSTIYLGKDGKLYQKATDLNDYYNPKFGGSTVSTLAAVGDFFSSPVVQTTGIQPVLKEKYNLVLDPYYGFRPAVDMHNYLPDYYDEAGNFIDRP